jgi:hypothetical protein
MFIKRPRMKSFFISIKIFKANYKITLDLYYIRNKISITT